MLISLHRRDRIGYLYDDGWTVEAWIGRGGDLLLPLLSTGYLAEHCTVEQPPKEPIAHRRLHDMAQQSGSPIDEPTGDVLSVELLEPQRTEPDLDVTGRPLVLQPRLGGDVGA